MSDTDHHELAIWFEPAVDGRYGTVARSDGGATARATFTPPARGAALDRLLASLAETIRRSAAELRGVAHLHSGEQESVTPKAVGGALFEALFQGAVGELLSACLGNAETAGQRRGMHLRLHFDLAHPDLQELARLPWELLYWHRRRSFLALSRLTPVVRYLDLPRPERALAARSPVQVLVATSPTPARPLDLARERDAIVDALARTDRLEVELLDPITPRELEARVARQPIDVLHFMGHGRRDPTTGDGILVLNQDHLGDDDGDDDGGAEVPVDGRWLAAQLGDETLGMVVLNACDSGHAAEATEHDPFAGAATALVGAGVPVVVAMQFPISDRAAIAFARAFYAGLAAGDDPTAAVTAGRKAILADHPRSLEWATPVLFQRSARPAPHPRPRWSAAGRAAAAAAATLTAVIACWWLGLGSHRARESFLGMDALDYPPVDLGLTGANALAALPGRGLGALVLAGGPIRAGAFTLLAVSLLWPLLGRLRRPRSGLAWLAALAAATALTVGVGAFYTAVLQSASLRANGPRTAPRCARTLSANPTTMAAFEVCSWLENDGQGNDARRRHLSGLLAWLLLATAATARAAARRRLDGRASSVRWALVAVLAAEGLFLACRLPLAHAYAAWGLTYPQVETVDAACAPALAAAVADGRCMAFDVTAGARDHRLLVRGAACATFAALEDGCFTRLPSRRAVLSVAPVDPER